VVVKKGWRRGDRKRFIQLDRNRIAAVVNNVHLIDHGWLYQNPRFYAPPHRHKTELQLSERHTAPKAAMT
jgi:hypothetical protein